MKKNPDTVHLFVKGKQGRCAFVITDANGNEIYSDRINDLKDEIPSHCDWEAIIKGLEYINQNRGNNKIPQDPSVKIFTTYENVYQTAVIQTQPTDIPPELFHRFETARNNLHRSNIRAAVDNNVKTSWVPNKFVNKMDDLEESLKKRHKDKP